MAAKAITAFSFITPAATGTISGLTISITVPLVTDVTALVASFTTTGASVNVSGAAQTTGVTANDFTTAVTYTVVAADATEQDYVVTVKVSEVTPLQIAQLRRMVAEPTTTTYSDALLIDAIMRYPHMDEWEETPLDAYGDANDDWTPTFDLNAAAGDVWEEKASAASHKYDFSADGGSFSASQQYEQYMKQARSFRSRRLPSTVAMVKSPPESQLDEHWIGNLPEE